MDYEFEFSDVMDRVHRIIKSIEPHDSVERYTKLGVDCFEGEANILSPHKIEINNKTISCRSIIVATGASPLVPKIQGLEEINYLTSENIWKLKKLPNNFLIIGGGPIGMEMAQAFSRLGSNVTVVEMAPKVLVREDDDVIDFVNENFKKENINILTKHKAVEVSGKTLICEVNTEKVTLKFDEIFIALGRKANISGFGLDKLNIKIRGNGTVKANKFLQTNYSNIYVCGDVTGPYQFTHSASHQAWYASVNALFSPIKKFKVDYSIIPWATFTDPEIARVGLNEQDAKIQNINYEVTKYDISDLDRAITDSKNKGFIKVLTVPGKDKVLGVTIVGEHAGDTIAEYVLAIKNNIGLNKILGTIHIYPTLAEANKFVAGVWKRKNTPKFIFKFLKFFHDLMR
jgi:pyruvate/2-oxoglutarate dehydrogenase complex dihydrolipoamide dehydrogenase (E3) component